MYWTLAVVLLILIAFISWISKGVIYQSVTGIPEVSTIKHGDFKVIAHRGYSSKAPENTLAAFRLALNSKADMIELDVHLSKDDQVIVIHDATLARTTGTSGTVRSKTVAELKKLEAGAWFDAKFKGEPIPTLEEAIQLVNGESILLIEIKVDEHSNVYPNLVKGILALIEQYDASTWCILQAFESEYLKEIQAAKASVPYYKLIVNTHAPIPTYIDSQFRWGVIDKSIPFQAINPYYKTLTPNQVKQWHDEGYEVHTYTVNERETMQQIAQMGVDGIITNYPARAITLREEIRKSQ
ncbi:MAG: glycerophosphodiester phosphodiesterase [Flammeovirgaceae bacterium]